jgi:hypothetical protein
MNRILSAALLLFNTSLFSQDSSSRRLIFSSYIEIYYQYDFNKPPDNKRPSFIYSHNRHNEFNLNLGYLKARYEVQKLRANLAFGTGTYMNANYAAEPGVLKNVFEANAGVRVSKKNIWIDAGILPSHIGFETAVSKDCWNLTRSIMAENSPYFEAGAKLSYTPDNNKWLFSVMALNGWQRITRLNGNSLVSWGAQIQFKPSDKILFNYSNFIGTDKPDSARQNRVFHNFYGIYTLADKFGLTAGFDIGTEEKLHDSRDKSTWYSLVLILKYKINDQWSMAARGEYYSDKNGVIIPVNTPRGFKTTGFSFNINYSPADNIRLRVEARTLQSRDKIFIKQTGWSSNNTAVTTSLAAFF